MRSQGYTRLLLAYTSAHLDNLLQVEGARHPELDAAQGRQRERILREAEFHDRVWRVRRGACHHHPRGANYGCGTVGPRDTPAFTARMPTQ